LKKKGGKKGREGESRKKKIGREVQISEKVIITLTKSSQVKQEKPQRGKGRTMQQAVEVQHAQRRPDERGDKLSQSRGVAEREGRETRLRKEGRRKTVYSKGRNPNRPNRSDFTPSLLREGGKKITEIPGGKG